MAEREGINAYCSTDHYYPLRYLDNPCMDGAAQMITCCRNCDERRAGCHADCERYAEQKAEHEAARLGKSKIKESELDAIRYARDLKTRIHTGRFRK